MKQIKLYIVAISLVVCASLTSCVKDLNVTPIDPNIALPEDVLNSEDAYFQVLAKCYQGLACSSTNGPDGSPDIDGVDGGYGQYMRALFNLNTVTTDEATVCWNDGTLRHLHQMRWTSTNEFNLSMYFRIYYQISLCNEFIRRGSASEFANGNNMKLWLGEARALRALSYYHAIDMYGNVPFATEDQSVGSTGPDQIMRADLYKWLVDECKDILTIIPEKAPEYGRVSGEMVKMILAKLYLNSMVYTDGAVNNFAECAQICREIMTAHPTLEPNYLNLFGADNDKFDEIIFAVVSEGTNTRSYGSTNYLILASLNGDYVAWKDKMGAVEGWGGLTVTSAFIDKFDKKDARYTFTDCSEFDPKGEYVHTYVVNDDNTFLSGYCTTKWRNIKSDGTPGNKTNSTVDTDYPVFRAADAYLMFAEATLCNGGNAADAVSAVNVVRKRAGLASLASVTLDDILDERGRELYWENFRRSDLIRFGKYVGSDYVWEWKGGVAEGTSVDAKFKLFPIPANDINSNSKLTQNAGY